MIIKISDRTPAQLEGLEKFFHSQNWVSSPIDNQLGFFDPGVTAEDRRSVEHPFAKLVRKTKDLSPHNRGSERYNITIEVDPYITDMGGNPIKVPLSFLAGLMQSLDLFSKEFKPTDLDLF